LKTRFLGLLLFLSGASALILEVCWFRRTAQVAGATSIAMAAVLAAVIGGMAAGSFLLGRRADRTARPLRLYGLLEVGIVLGALATPTLLDFSQAAFDGLQRWLDGAPLTFARFLLATLLLAPPAVLMGGTLPAVACAVRAGPQRGRTLGWLYASNTLGAVAGTVAAGFVLIPTLGLAWATRSAAIFAGTAAAVALLTRARTGPPAPTAREPIVAAREARAILLYAVSGFLGLAAEVAFVRSLVLVFGSTTYAFTTMLAIFLLGIGAGGALGAASPVGATATCAASRRPSPPPPRSSASRRWWSTSCRASTSTDTWRGAVRSARGWRCVSSSRPSCCCRARWAWGSPSRWPRTSRPPGRWARARAASTRPTPSPRFWARPVPSSCSCRCWAPTTLSWPWRSGPRSSSC
jgi:MFS family permease